MESNTHSEQTNSTLCWTVPYCKRVDRSDTVRRSRRAFSFSVSIAREKYHDSFPRTAPSGVHAHRAAGGHCHHRRADRVALARRAEGPRGGQPHGLHQQPEATGVSRPHLPRHVRPDPGDAAEQEHRPNNKTWALMLLPYIEQGNVANQWDPTKYYYQQVTQEANSTNTFPGTTPIKTLSAPPARHYECLY